MNQHVKMAINSLHMTAQHVATLEGNNQLLIEGAAKQATTIRTLSERNSTLEAEVTLERYNVEFLKNQGRKTRLVKRALQKKISDLKSYLGQALDRAERAEAANEILRTQMSKMIAQQTELMAKNDKLEASIDRMMDGQPLPFQIVTEPAPFRVVLHTGQNHTYRMDQVDVRQLGMSLRIAPEHRRDLLAHAEMAKDAARQVAHKMELAILEALRGEQVTHDDITKARLNRLTNYQRQQQNDRSFDVYGF
jgi:hypothetical protein